MEPIAILATVTLSCALGIFCARQVLGGVLYIMARRDIRPKPAAPARSDPA